jgi:hypothetical protein
MKLHDLTLVQLQAQIAYSEWYLAHKTSPGRRAREQRRLRRLKREFWQRVYPEPVHRVFHGLK